MTGPASRPPAAPAVSTLAGLPDPQPGPLALGDPHARALALAAQRPTEALGPLDAGWLDAHLAACAACRGTAVQYQEDRLLLRALRDRAPRPPRDLWARTSAALEREASRPVRIRRASQPPRPRAPYREPRWSPGLVSGLLVIALVAGSSLLSGLGRTFFPAPSASGLVATPIAVSADVRWIQTGPDGSFDIVLGQVDRVCPAGSPASCGPLHDVTRTSVSLGAAPRSVSLSPSSAQLVVVAGNGASGGSVYVLPVPSSLARPTAAPGAGGSPAAASSGPAGRATPTVSVAPASSATSGAIAIAENVIVVGGTAGHSPDGRWFAFSARPADGSTGPDIYVWRVGDARARTVTGDHRSIFSGWLGSRILGSRVGDSVAPVSAGSPAPSGSVAPGSAGPSRAPAPSPSAPSLSPLPSAVQRTDASSSAPSQAPSAAVPPSGSVLASIRPGFVVALERSVTSFLIDPETGARDDLAAGRFLRPVVDATGTWAVYWEGSVVSDRQGVDWMPGAGRLIVARWSGPSPTSVPAASPTSSAGTSAIPSAAAPTSLSGSATPSIRPSPASSSPTLRSGAAPVSGAPGASATTGSPMASASSAAPSGPQALVDGPMLDFDAAFDSSGTHLAIWVANPADPSAGTLTLFSLKDGTWSVDPQHRLVGVPALRGFAIADGELVWVSPPDAAGRGSRIEVAGWVNEAFGSVQSVAGGRLIVIR